MMDEHDGARMGVALIGAGNASRAHLKALAMLEDRLELRGVWTRNPARAAETAARSGVAPPPVYPSFKALLEDSGVAFAIVATPPDTRNEIVPALARAGKAILLEKPIERTAEAAEALVALCEAEGAPLGLVFQHRMRAGARRLRELVEAQALGALGAVEIRIPWWRGQDYYDTPGRGTFAQDGGGVLITQAIHTLDLALSLTAQVVRAQALAATTRLHRMECEDFVAGGLNFTDGAVGSVTASTAFFPGSAESIALHGETGSAILTGGDLRVRFRGGREERVEEPAETGGGADPMAFPADWHRDLIADFAEALREGRPPLVPGREGLRVQRLIEALLASAREGRAVELETPA